MFATLHPWAAGRALLPCLGSQAPSPRRYPIPWPTLSCSKHSHKAAAGSHPASSQPPHLQPGSSWSSTWPGQRGDSEGTTPYTPIPPSPPPWDSPCQSRPQKAQSMLKTPSPPYLVDSVPALRVLAQQVPRQDDTGDLRSAALLALCAQLPCHHVHQQLRAQQGLAAPAAQPQPRHQQDKPRQSSSGSMPCSLPVPIPACTATPGLPTPRGFRQPGVWGDEPLSMISLGMRRLLRWAHGANTPQGLGIRQGTRCQPCSCCCRDSPI